jgi:hypothetical protein
MGNMVLYIDIYLQMCYYISMKLIIKILNKIFFPITYRYNKLFFCYKKGQFLPIYEGDDWVNRSEFVRYKIKVLLIRRSLA